MKKDELRELQKKPWWNYAILIAGIFLFSEGSSMLYGTDNKSIPISAIFFGIIILSEGMKQTSKKFILLMHKDSSQNMSLIETACSKANWIMCIILLSIVFASWKVGIIVTTAILYVIIANIIYLIMADIFYKSQKKKSENNINSDLKHK